MQLHLCATPRAEHPDGTSQLLAPLDAALLAWLAVEGPTPRNRLAALLWPDKAPEAARNSLRQRLFQMRRQLGLDLVEGSAVVQLVRGVTHDLQDANHVLDGVALQIDGDFAQWLDQQRERRRSRVRRSMVEMSEMAEAAKDWDDALSHARELLALEPLSEEAHRRVMRLHYLAGDRASALLAFDHCEQVLKDEVGARPSAETMALLATVSANVGAAVVPAHAAVPVSVLRPPRMVGRERELAALATAWQAEHVAGLVGEAGMGKTRLLQEFVAARPDVMIATGRPGDAGVPFATLARLLRTVAAAGAVALPMATRGEIARVLPEFDTGGHAPRGEGQRLVLLRAVQALLASRPPQSTLVVDDLHFADAASLDLLAGLIDGEDAGADTPSLRWLLAWRPAEAGSALHALLDRLTEPARLVPIALAPLDEAALAELVDSLVLPGVEGRALAAGLLQRTGGNPLFVLETLKQAWVERTLAQLADARQLPRPLSVARLIERRLARLSPGALALARAAAIAGVDFDIALAEHVLGVSALQFADALNELEAAQVMRGPQFAHDLVYEALQASVPRAIARHLHARIADWLEQHRGAPARVALHWVDAAQPTRALPWLAKAAEAANTALRPKEYVAFMETKSAIEEAAGDRAAAFESLYVAAEKLRDTLLDFERGLVLCDRIEALACNPVQRVKALLERGLLYAWMRETGTAIDILRRALSELERSGVHDEALAAEVHRGLGVAYQQGSRAHDALVHMRTALAWYDHHAGVHERAQAHGDLAIVLDSMGRLDESLTHHQIAIEQMRAAGDVCNLSIAWGNLAVNRIDAGDLGAADTGLLQAEQIIASHDDLDSGLPSLQALHVLVSCHLGRYRDALASAEQCIEATRRTQPALLANAQLRLAQCWLHLGQWARMRQILDSVTPDPNGPLTVVVVHARLQVAYLRAHAGAAAQGGTAMQRLRELRERLTAENERPDLRLTLCIELAAGAAPVNALAELSEVAREARQMGHLGTVRAAHVRAAEVAVAVDAERACREALAALALADAGCRDTIVLPAELWLHAGRALAAADDGRARQVLARGRQWVLDAAQQHVPEPFRDSFLHRNPANRELLALAAQLGAH